MEELNLLRYRIKILVKFKKENPTYFDIEEVDNEIELLRAEILEIL